MRVFSYYSVLLGLVFFSTSNLHGQITLKPNQSILHGIEYPTTDGSNGQVLGTNGAGKLIWLNSGGGSTAGTGINSTAVGFDNTAAGDSSSAVGYRNSASNFLDNAFGSRNLATGNRSSAFGNENEATSSYSSAFGNENEVKVRLSSAFGNFNAVAGERSSAFGHLNEATGNDSSAFGSENQAIGNLSSAFGYFNDAAGTISSAFGYNNDAAGTTSSAFGYENESAGEGSSAFGHKNKTTVFGSSAFGYFNDATGVRSSTFGHRNEATGNGSSAFGYDNRATGNDSSAFGYANETSSERSSALGYFNDATGERSSAFGYELESNLYGLTVVGIRNNTVAGSKTAWVASEPVFMVGNGRPLFARSTALTILKNGNTGIGTMAPTQRLSVNGSAGKPGGGSWSSFSDRRLKNKIQDFEDGLAQVLRIRPVRYSYNGKAGMPTDKSYVGVVAQEMQKVAPYTVASVTYRAEGRAPKNYLTYDGTAVTYMLVNAVQEQQELIETQRELVDSQKKEITNLTNQVSDLEAEVQELAEVRAEVTELKQLVQQLVADRAAPQEGTLVLSAQALLAQNQPNPFSEQTLIRYTVPANVQRAQIRITTTDGRVLANYPIEQAGEGELTLEAGTLPAGTYFYSLLLDGQVQETHRMVLTHH
ncbi:MAG: tail fiber domain-containing protein [Bacteroidota bacterium]